MSLIITPSDYFINDIYVPIKSNTNLNVNFTDALTRYEDECLKLLLGYTLWKAFKAGLEEETPDEKWTNLRDGAEFSFEYCGKTINTKWNGLINDDKISILAYYTYFYYRKDHETTFDAIGESSTKTENAKRVSGVPKMVSAWNKMIELYGKTPFELTRYSNYFLESSNYEHYNPLPSAYNFLLANIDTYDDWAFTPIRSVNIFGI